MPESFVRVAPDSSGKMMRTRERVIGSNTVQEQYTIAQQSEAVVRNRVWVSSLRIPARTLGAGVTQPLFSVWNGIATGGNMVSIRRLSVEIDTITAQTVASPILRLFRQTAASGATSGTTLTPVHQYTADPAFSSLVVVKADHQADNANATTPLTAGTIGTQPMWSQTVPRYHTLAGFQAIAEYTLLPNDGSLLAVDPLILRPGEGMHIQVIAGGAVASAAFTFAVKTVLAEFVYP